MHEPVYPDGWAVETSDAADSWSQAYDPASRVLSVTTPETGGSHTICVRPAGSSPGCAGTPAVPTEPAGPGGSTGAGGGVPMAVAATPVAGRPTYTG